jgi:Domain of unknown function (DUF4226)
MATPDEVLAVVEHVKQCTGDPNAWLTGLTPQDVTDAAALFAASPPRLDGLVSRIRQQHPDLFDSQTGERIYPAQTKPTAIPQRGPTASDHQEGDAAEAIRNAEIALAHQNSTTAQVDLQVVTAVLNAHQQNAAGREALSVLQRDIESAVANRSDLDTPAGARDFQRYLIGKLRDIRAVVAGASLDDTSNSALMAAWTSLYNAAQPGPDAADNQQWQRVVQNQPAATESELKPYFDAQPDDDLGLPSEDMPAQSAPAPAPTSEGMPNFSPFAGGGVPGGGALPGLGMPGGFPLSGPLPGSDLLPPRASGDPLPESDDPKDDPLPGADGHDPDGQEDAEPATAHPAGPTTVTLPDGETLTAASPQLAAAIEAAAGGTPIADAFRHEGITIPPPGTAVSDPVDPSQLAPGDIGMFTDRHALALGASRALINGQIQHISTVGGPSFLGWEHPPVPVSAPAPDKPDPPAPTRPARADRPQSA